MPIDFGAWGDDDDNTKKVIPEEIYDNLDRQVDKGPLRPAQKFILNEWYSGKQKTKDVMVKLHTGQGKTLVGLLVLQSIINQEKGPCLYVCPNKQLAKQTYDQAVEFGIKAELVGQEIPISFENGESILISHVQKVFNGWTKFGLGGQSTPLGCVVVDDAHACVDSIRESSIIKVNREHALFKEFLDLFRESLLEQGRGTFRDIEENEGSNILAVPYWDWMNKEAEVVRYISNHLSHDDVKFAWPLIKDILYSCTCVISNRGLQITPQKTPIEKFGFFHKASHRVFMSATMADDSYLVAGLEVDSEAVKSPLVYPDEKWSGEKMVLLPQLIDDRLNTAEVMTIVTHPPIFNFVSCAVIVPSDPASVKWTRSGGRLVKTENIDSELESMRSGDKSIVRVFSNRYEGLDLPDSSCRVLVLDGKPSFHDFQALYEASVRTESEIIDRSIVRSIEQGMGRSVRGERDYSVIFLLGPDLIRLARANKTRGYFSQQTQKQVAIGLELAAKVSGTVSSDVDPREELWGIALQCLNRETGWKNFYSRRMSEVDNAHRASEMLPVYEKEKDAEKAFISGDYEKAEKCIDKLIELVDSVEEKGWYLQQRARCAYKYSKTESQTLQAAAHKRNSLLFKPRAGVTYKSISLQQQGRVQYILDWVRSFNSSQDMTVAVVDVLDRLAFGVDHRSFESALAEVGVMLGFQTQRPDSEWKEGPDVLWAVNENKYIIWEAKNEVKLTRADISKGEVEQLDSSVAWFNHNYRGCSSDNIMIIPAKTFAKGVHSNNLIRVMDVDRLGRLVSVIKAFFAELARLDPHSISEVHLSRTLDRHGLSADKLASNFTVAMIR